MGDAVSPSTGHTAGILTYGLAPKASRIPRPRPASRRSSTAADWWVSRPRLETKLTAGVQGRLTVVTGPPGAGKTALLAGWARGRPEGSVAWVSLEAADNAPARFWKRIDAALAFPRLPEERSDRTAAGLVRPSPGAIPGRLGCLAGSPGTVLVVDGFDVLNNRRVIDAFGTLVRSLSLGLPIVVAGRNEPDLRLHRLRLSGELTEIVGDDLRFRVGEARELLARLSPSAIFDHNAVALTAHTEGWALGLRLAAGADDARSGGASRWHRCGGPSDHVAAYFNDQVLGQMSFEEEQFLLDTAVLHRLSGEVCEQLSGRPDAQLILESLAARHLFLVRLEGRNGWYRHHRLFGEFLRQRVIMDDPARAKRAGLLAAAWFRTHGDAATALHHLVDADAYDEVLALTSSSRADEPIGACPGLRPTSPAVEPDAECRSQYALAAALLQAGQADAGLHWLGRLEVAVGDRPGRQTWRSGIEFLWALHAALAGDPARVLRHCERVRLVPLSGERRPPMPSGRSAAAALGQVPSDSSVSTGLAVLAARAHLWLDQPERARAVLADGGRVVGAADDSGGANDPGCLGIRALLASRSGQLQEAYQLANSALEEADRGQHAPVLAVLDSSLALATVLWERRALAEATRRLELALESADGASKPPAFWPLECLLIRVMISRGRGSEALGRIAVLRTLPWQPRCPAPVRPALAVLEGRCWDLLGNRHRALEALAALPPTSCRPEVRAWADLCAGRPDRAAASLTGAPDRTSGSGRQLRRMTLLARAQVQLGEERAALATLHRAVDLGRPQGYVTAFVEQAPELVAGLQRIAGRYPDAYLSTVLEHVERTHPPATRAGPAFELEPLSAREREILIYLPSHRSQGEIAAEMYVSINTVKTHIRAVYRKLGVTSRSEAVARARTYQLI